MCFYLAGGVGYHWECHGSMPWGLQGHESARATFRKLRPVDARILAVLECPAHLDALESAKMQMLNMFSIVFLFPDLGLGVVRRKCVAPLCFQDLVKGSRYHVAKVNAALAIG